jgi:hypothetical protein
VGLVRIIQHDPQPGHLLGIIRENAMSPASKSSALPENLVAMFPSSHISASEESSNLHGGDE